MDKSHFQTGHRTYFNRKKLLRKDNGQDGQYVQSVQECIVCKTLNLEDNNRETTFHKLQNNHSIRQFWFSQYNIDATKINHSEDIYVCSNHLNQTEEIGSEDIFEQTETETTQSFRWLNKEFEETQNDDMLVTMTTKNGENTASSTENIFNVLANNNCRYANIEMDSSRLKIKSRSIAEKDVTDNLLTLEDYKNKIRLLKQQYVIQKRQIRSCHGAISRLKLKIAKLTTTLETKYKIEESDDSDYIDEDMEEEEFCKNYLLNI